jgi:hypothetical protein
MMTAGVIVPEEMAGTSPIVMELFRLEVMKGNLSNTFYERLLIASVRKIPQLDQNI